jgi:Heterokaryon incompatibility protein Het-C
VYNYANSYKDYADNEDARKYDSRLRGPVDEAKELAVDERTALKAYIASEDRGIDTSAGLVRKRFEEAIERGRAYGRDGRDEDLYEALRLLGTGLHCLEGRLCLTYTRFCVSRLITV